LTVDLIVLNHEEEKRRRRGKEERMRMGEDAAF